MNTLVVKQYVHDEQERHDMEADGPWSQGAHQYKEYLNPLYEIELDIEVEYDTGKCRIIAVDGHALATLPEFS